MISAIKTFFWNFGKKRSLRVWSNLIFMIAFVIPALFVFGFSLVSTFQNYRNESLVLSSNIREKVKESFQEYLISMEQKASSFLKDKHLRLLFSSLNNVDRYEEENPILKRWLSEELLLLKKANQLDGLAIISLNNEVLAHTHTLDEFPPEILETPIVKTPQYRTSVSGLQQISVKRIQEVFADFAIPFFDLKEVAIIIAKVPIVEKDAISGTLLIYRRFLNGNEWIEKMIDEYQISMDFYFNQASSFHIKANLPKLDIKESIIKAMGIWKNSEPIQQQFDPENISDYPDRTFLILEDYEKNQIGTIGIGIDTRQYYNSIFTSVALFAVLSLVWIFLGFIFRIWTLRIIGRIHYVSDSIREISVGNYHNRLKMDGHQEISDLSNEINKMALEIHKREQLKDDFLANTSHELRTPLLGIIGLAESMIEGSSGPLTKKALSQLSIISSSGIRLSKLINDILDVAKLKNNNLVLQKRPIDLHSMVEVVINLLSPLVATKKLVLLNQIDKNCPFIEGDEERITQVFFNLIGNAIKFTERGSVSIKANREDETIRISVKDTGMGIPKENIDRIFKTFQQSSSNQSHQFGGTGLGLSLSKYLIELHGGSIDVISQPDVGSTFCFSLPISYKQRTEFDEMELESPNNYQVKREKYDLVLTDPFLQTVPQVPEVHDIVIVDDDHLNLKIISGYLPAEKYRIFIFDNGNEALQFIHKNKPSLVLLDIMMPNISGFEVCQKIREDYAIDDLPVIFLTAKSQVSDLLKGFSSGANDYITKPFLKNELLVRIDRHLEVSRSISRLRILNTFSKQLKRASDTRQIMDHLFQTICSQMDTDSAILYNHNKAINDYRSTDDKWAREFLKTDHHEEEIISLKGKSSSTILSVTVSGFEEYRLLFYKKLAGAQFSKLDREYIQNLINRIKDSRYQFEEISKDPNLLVSLFKIQSSVPSVLYIRTKSPYCYVYRKNREQPDVHRISIKLLQRFFSEDNLLKIQRSYLVNPDRVTALKKTGKDDMAVMLDSGSLLPVSRSLITKIQSRFPDLMNR